MSKKSETYFFKPLFCPNSRCKFHTGGENFYKLNGQTKTQKPPFINKRFKCKSCSHQFSENTFSLDFRKRFPNLSKKVFQMSMNGMTNRSIARNLGVREKVIRNRIALLSRQAQLFENEKELALKILEPVCYDGFETFSGSQFSPCYVNTAVGKNSLYTYVLSFSPLNRKGRMTPWQKKKNSELQIKFGKYPTNSIAKLTDYTFSKILKKSERRKIILHTDEHKTYEYILKANYNHFFEHIKTNSKERRNTTNPLFSVNHLHLNYRHFLSSQRRETIAFNKNEAGLMDRMILMKVHKNFMRPKILRQRKVAIPSPAMELGICNRVLDFEDVFKQRRFKSHHNLDEVEENLYMRNYPYSRQKIVEYKGA